MNAIAPDDLAPLFAGMKSRFGSDAVATDEATRTLMSEDIYARAPHHVQAVLRPKSLGQLANMLTDIATAGLAVFPRGGGMSYTSGYLNSTPDGVVVDLAFMNQILEINTEDMYVTVQAGCTWESLYTALKDTGLRTPFWGPLSGLKSSIGGGLSQNNAFFGAGTQGPSGESVISLSVVLADGTLIKTGSAGGKNTSPFFRHYGPDLTGLFVGDCGALGIKAEVTLRLITAPTHEDWLSYTFTERDDFVRAASTLSRAGLGCEICGFDPNLNAMRMKRDSLSKDVSALANVVTGQKSLLSGLKEGVKIATAGRSFMDTAQYGLHVVLEGRSAAGVADDATAAHKILSEHGGSEVANTIPKVFRSNPFMPLNNMLGANGERWVPIHAIFAHSKGIPAWADIDALFDSRADDMGRLQVQTGVLLTTVSSNGLLIEPVFYWPDEIYSVHEVSVEADHLAKLTRFEPNPEARALVQELREGIIDICIRYGAAHFQIGRTYPYARTRTSETLEAIKALKAALDPDHRMNPGVLGL